MGRQVGFYALGHEQQMLLDFIDSSGAAVLLKGVSTQKYLESDAPFLYSKENVENAPIYFRHSFNIYPKTIDLDTVKYSLHSKRPDISIACDSPRGLELSLTEQSNGKVFGGRIYFNTQKPIGFKSYEKLLLKLYNRIACFIRKWERIGGDYYGARTKQQLLESQLKIDHSRFSLDYYIEQDRAKQR